MPYNIEYPLLELAKELDSSGSLAIRNPPVRHRIPSAYCLPERLPGEGFLKREGEQSAPRAVLAQLRRSPSPTDIADALESSIHSAQASKRKSSDPTGNGRPPKPKLLAKPPGWRDPEPYEIFRAIENKDVMYLMQVRDHAFHLLLKKTGDATPLVHAMRIGKSHRDIAIILLGAMSRWVNHLDDEDIEKPNTKVILKALRTNLKLAIDHGLASSQNDLIPSFLQTLVMSEGDRWVRQSTETVSLALRQGTEGKPVETANSSVRVFATRELGKAEFIAALEDYISNATADLLILGVWYQLQELDPTNATPIPAYYFARDDRIYRAFEERLKVAKLGKATKRLRWQIRVLTTVMEARNVSYRQKVELLRAELDEGPGV